MEQKVGLIALDLDGTLLAPLGGMSPRVRRALEGAVAGGVHVVPATGRQLAGIPKEVKEISGVRYAITANGALVVDMHSGQTVYADCFEDSEAQALLAALEQYDAVLGLYVDGKGYSEPLSEDQRRRLDPQMVRYLDETRLFVPSLQMVAMQSGGRTEKLTMVFADAAERENAWRMLRGRGDNCTTSSLAFNLEINTATANKGTALLALARHLDVPQSQTMAVGDGMNDVEMLRAAGLGVAMGNADADVKAAADALTLSWREDGAALAIEKALRLALPQM